MNLCGKKIVLSLDESFSDWIFTLSAIIHLLTTNWKTGFRNLEVKSLFSLAPPQGRCCARKSCHTVRAANDGGTPVRDGRDTESTEKTFKNSVISVAKPFAAVSLSELGERTEEVIWGKCSLRRVGDRLLFVGSEAQSLFWLDVFFNVLVDLCKQELYLFPFANSQSERGPEGKLIFF